MVAMAAEDIGLADPMALQVAVAALHALQFLGLPEGQLPLTEAAVYLAAAPKSNAVVRAIGAATDAARNDAQHPVPVHLRNATSELGKQLGHGRDYVYAHDVPGGIAAMPCLPPELSGRQFFVPGERGFEKRVAERMAENERVRRSGKHGAG
jgi:putative ATPase